MNVEELALTHNLRPSFARKLLGVAQIVADSVSAGRPYGEGVAEALGIGTGHASSYVTRCRNLGLLDDIQANCAECNKPFRAFAVRTSKRASRFCSYECNLSTGSYYIEPTDFIASSS